LIGRGHLNGRVDCKDSSEVAGQRVVLRVGPRHNYGRAVEGRRGRNSEVAAARQLRSQARVALQRVVCGAGPFIVDIAAPVATSNNGAAFSWSDHIQELILERW